jgi:hypothetical protein
MCNPLALLYGLGPSRQCHEVALDNVLSVGVIEPKWERARNIVSRERISAG